MPFQRHAPFPKFNIKLPKLGWTLEKTCKRKNYFQHKLLTITSWFGSTPISISTSAIATYQWSTVWQSITWKAREGTASTKSRKRTWWWVSIDGSTKICTSYCCKKKKIKHLLVSRNMSLKRPGHFFISMVGGAAYFKNHSWQNAAFWSVFRTW